MYVPIINYLLIGILSLINRSALDTFQRAKFWASPNWQELWKFIPEDFKFKND